MQAGVTLLKFGGVSAVSAACAVVFSTVLFIWNFFQSKYNLQKFGIDNTMRKSMSQGKESKDERKVM